MKVEVLVSTMHKKDLSLVKEMDIKTDVLIINQCDEEKTVEYQLENMNVREISTLERGLAKSRNMAIENSKGEICVIADDDLIYSVGFQDVILEAYRIYPEASIIAFEVPSTDSKRPTSSLAEGKVDFLHTLKISSFQITFKRQDIVDNNISFNELFGAGAKYTCGEEHIFLAEALKKGLKVKYRKEKIGIVNHNDSTWYNGFDKHLFVTKGAMFYEMSPIMSLLLVGQFSIRKWSRYRGNISLYSALTHMLDGISDYKKHKYNSTEINS